MFQIWQTVTATSIPADGQRSSDRTALLRTPGGQDPNRDTHSGYASQWRLLQLALHGDTMTSGPHLGSGAHIEHVGHCLDVRCVSLVVLESVANYQQRQQFTATVPEWRLGLKAVQTFSDILLASRHAEVFLRETLNQMWTCKQRHGLSHQKKRTFRCF